LSFAVQLFVCSRSFFSSSNSRKPTDITRRNRPAGRETCEICTKKEYAVADETSTAEAVNQKQVRLDEPKRERRERRERREHRLGGEPGPQSGEKRLRDTGDHPKREGGIRFEAHEPRSRNRRGYGGGKLLSHLSRRSRNTGKMRRSFKTQQTERSLEPKWLAAEISLG
jgi:hypothetical protein